MVVQLTEHARVFSDSPDLLLSEINRFVSRCYFKIRFRLSFVSVT